MLVLVLNVNFSTFAEHAQEAEKEGISTEEALIRLQNGNARYREFNFSKKEWEITLKEVYGGQKPYAIILTCSDSRVPPEYIFDAGLGEIFVVRTAGNLVDPIVLGSIEYAVEHLGAQLLVIMGHEKCGAVTAAAKHSLEKGNIPAIVEAIQPAVRLVKDADVEEVILKNADVMAQRALAESSILNEFAAIGKLKVVTAKYFLKDGHVEFH